jgi:hypothetical protein
MRKASLILILLIGAGLLAAACSGNGTKPAASKTYIIAPTSSPSPSPSPSPVPAQTPPPSGSGNAAPPAGNACNGPNPPQECFLGGGTNGALSFANASVLAQSVAHEQSNALAAMPASEYDSTDDAPVSVSCTQTSTTETSDSFTCTGSDSDGDVGSTDDVTVTAGSYYGTQWSDTGMSWTGPDVSNGPAFVAAVSGWTTP